MATTVSDVLRIAPEFGDVYVEDIERFIADASSHLNVTIWGTKYDRGVTLYACHLMALAMPRRVHSDVTSEAAGGVSRSYSGGAAMSEAGSNRFEVQFLKLLKSLGATMVAT
jgi:hypothetical protein